MRRCSAWVTSLHVSWISLVYFLDLLIFVPVVLSVAFLIPIAVVHFRRVRAVSVYVHSSLASQYPY